MITLDSVRLWIETRNGASFEDERMAVVGKSAEHFECPVVGRCAEGQGRTDIPELPTNTGPPAVGHLPLKGIGRDDPKMRRSKRAMRVLDSVGMQMPPIVRSGLPLLAL
ncbi:hypothetical protein [Sphingomonas sp. GC_Shp_3]|uniref:hypothetical protein n=1 Tax=Sphingomonas sp. GC_Shp_3 TaxID=2937383 RepID=UPI00226ADEBE|nr:hypothetical protein [Sphingomonas sp. GC_Shp_3]